MNARALMVALACGAAACGPPRMKLPAGPGTPAVPTLVDQAFLSATAPCHAVTSLTAEVGVTGRVGGRRVRGRLTVGVAAPAEARIEALAPFGPPVFVLAAHAGQADVVLPRDRRFLAHAVPSALVAALTGVPLDAADLRLLLAGCPATTEWRDARQFGDEWLTLASGGDQLFFQRDRPALPWALVAIERRAGARAGATNWREEYRERVDGVPRAIRVTSAGAANDAASFELELTQSQVELNLALGPEVFDVAIPAGALPITLDELRRNGPLGEGIPMRDDRMRLRAPAKINVTLRVLGTRPDGYHQLRTVFQTLALSDVVDIRAAKGPLQLSCDDPSCPSDRTNLVWMAAERLWAASGRTGEVRDLCIRLEKRIPARAGLGGGSSDAASTLRGLARAWRVEAPIVRTVAASLGADVPFFLEGGTALGLERGDLLFPLADSAPSAVVLVLPDFGVSTKDAYAWFDAGAAGGLGGRRGSARAADGDDEWRNDLQPVVAAHHPSIGTFVRRLRAAGAWHAAMSGSGSAVFGLFRSRSAAVSASQALAGRGRRLLVTRTVARAAFHRLVGIPAHRIDLPFAPRGSGRS